MGDYICSAIPSVIDNRDYAVCVRQPVTLPLRYRQSIPTNYHQEAGNCVMQSMRSCMWSIFKTEFGVDMGYGGYRSHSREGMYPNEAANGLCKYGIAPLKYDPGEREVPAVIALTAPAQEEKDGKDTYIRRTLRKGMVGDDVKELQSKLNELGHICGTADGKFGSRTRYAVKAFQRRHRLKADGIVGPNTWEVLDSV